MAELINLRRARKAKAKAEKTKAAEANRVTHGTPKTVRDLARAKTELAATRLENGRLENRRPDDDMDEDK